MEFALGLLDMGFPNDRVYLIEQESCTQRGALAPALTPMDF